MWSTQHDIAGGYRVDAGTLARFSALRDTATRHAVDASEQAFPEIYAHFGPSGRQACLDDVALHLDFLRPVLETGDLAPFVAYLRWLRRVLRARAACQPHSVPRSLRDLAAFFSQQLGDDAEPIVRALAAGEAALMEGGPSGEDDPPEPVEHGPSRRRMPPRRCAAMALRRRACSTRHSTPQARCRQRRCM